jgi:hypothetical protein
MFDPDYQETSPGVPGTFVIETSEGELMSSLARQATNHWFEIVPARALEPNTRYRVRGTWARDDGKIFHTQLEFTTGAGPRIGPVAAPVAMLQHLDLYSRTLTGCDMSPQATCVALAEDAMVAYGFIDDANQLNDDFGGIARASFFTGVLTKRLPQTTSFRCIRLRQRAVDGTFSEYTKLCGEDATVFHVAVNGPVECTNAGLVWPKDARVTENDEPPPPPPMRIGAGSGEIDAGRGDAAEPSDHRPMEGCSVRPAPEQSAGASRAVFTLCLAAWALRRMRTR